MRVSHVAIVLVVGGVVATVGLAFFGYVSIGWLNQKNLQDLTDQGLAAASGYTAAKTPAEAMDHFKDAIHARKYKYAAQYCTKPYADELTRAHGAAADLGDRIDRIRNWGTEKGLMTDKLTIALYMLDPFPTTFKVGGAPKQLGEDKAVGVYAWDLPRLKNPAFPMQFSPDMSQLDRTMFQTVLGPRAAFTQVQLVKEGEEWKLNIPMNPGWLAAINNFMEKHKTYHTALSGIVDDINREPYDAPSAFESAILGKLASAAKK